MTVYEGYIADLSTLPFAFVYRCNGKSIGEIHNAGRGSSFSLFYGVFSTWHGNGHTGQMKFR
jgi:hypothetical protein